MDHSLTEKVIFCFFTLSLPFIWLGCFRESWIRRGWHGRNNSVFVKPFRPDTSEAAYQRYRLLGYVCAVFFTLFWVGMFLSVGGPWLLILLRGG